MTEQPRRPILRLKGAADRPSPLSPPQPLVRWKCRPCGAAFDPPTDIGLDEAVRCPKCNARLGKAADFRCEPPAFDRLRARPVAAPRPKPAAPPMIKVRRTPLRATPKRD
jgi:DNA-directed RNA polymerase subunit RPC12/RpoP